MSETEHSPLLWTMEQDEPPDECWYVIQDGEGHVVCFATKDDAEVIIRAVNTHAQLVEAMEYAVKWLNNLAALDLSGLPLIGAYAISRDIINTIPEQDKGIDYLQAALDAAKEGERWRY